MLAFPATMSCSLQAEFLILQWGTPFLALVNFESSGGLKIASAIYSKKKDCLSNQD